MQSDAIAHDDISSTVRGTKRGSINDLVNPKKRKTASGIKINKILFKIHYFDFKLQVQSITTRRQIPLQCEKDLQ